MKNVAYAIRQLLPHATKKFLGNWDGNSFSDENLLQTFLIGMENLHMVNECVK